jgi:hypothetical protein
VFRRLERVKRLMRSADAFEIKRTFALFAKRSSSWAALSAARLLVENLRSSDRQLAEWARRWK